MDILDIHTHNLDNIASGIYSHSLLDGQISDEIPYWSASIHPWYLNDGNAEFQINRLRDSLTDKRMIAIGEAGLDKLSGASYKLQIETFRQIADIASQNGLPLIIHAVKSSNELLQIHNEIKPENPWIIHGFRGKKEMAQQYVNHGFYLSFGEKYNKEALLNTPLDRLFVETDESKKSIFNIIADVSNDLDMQEADLKSQIMENVSSVIF